MSKELPPIYRVIKVPNEFNWGALYDRITNDEMEADDWIWLGNFLYTVAYHAVQSYGLCKVEGEKTALSYDLTHDVLQKINKNKNKKLNLQDKSKFDGYLYKMIINRVRDTYRRRLRSPGHELGMLADQQEQRAFDEVADRYSCDQIASLIKKSRACSKLSKKVLIDSLIREKTDQEIAKKYKKKHGHIRQVKSQDMSKIRKDQNFMQKAEYILKGELLEK